MSNSVLPGDKIAVIEEYEQETILVMMVI